MSLLPMIESPRGVHMPHILYGTAWKAEKTADCVQRALGAGFRGIDTACQPKHYHEPGVGEGIAAFLQAGEHTRQDLYLQTKFTALSGQDPKRVPYDARAPLADQVAQSLQASLRNLRVEYLDCVVLHSPLSRERDTFVVWRAMEQAVEQGLVRQLGISNCYDVDVFTRLCRQASVQPAVLQNRFYADTGYDKALRALCRARQIVYQSFWTLTANPQLLAHGVLVALCNKYKRTPAQILFRYLTQSGIAPVTGTQSLDHMREDLAIFDFALDAIEKAAIDALL
jgi:diketogulonate reductase-like aldo/keto reductase